VPIPNRRRRRCSRAHWKARGRSSFGINTRHPVETMRCLMRHPSPSLRFQRSVRMDTSRVHADSGPCMQVTRSVDVLGTARWASIVRGWGDLAFVRNVSLANRAAHIIDHRLFVNDRPGAIVRTSPKTTEHRPIVIVIASTSGRPFGECSSPVYFLRRCGGDSLVALFLWNRRRSARRPYPFLHRPWHRRTTRHCFTLRRPPQNKGNGGRVE
jgi:hypothetical protein